MGLLTRERATLVVVDVQEGFRAYPVFARVADSCAKLLSAMRILEIMNDFRTLQLHISSHVSRAQASPPDDASRYHDGYVVMRQCDAEAQAILATHFNPGNLGLSGGAVGEGEVQKATMQRSAYLPYSSLQPRHCLKN